MTVVDSYFTNEEKTLKIGKLCNNAIIANEEVIGNQTDGAILKYCRDVEIELERIDEIPKGKPVYVHYHSGLRSYIACRILTGYGFDCYNLAGGYRFYESVINEKSVPEYICTECK